MEEQYTPEVPLEEVLNRCITAAEEAMKTSISRELSLVITKLQEVQLWLSKIIKKA